MQRSRENFDEGGDQMYDDLLPACCHGGSAYGIGSDRLCGALHVGC